MKFNNLTDLAEELSSVTEDLILNDNYIETDVNNLTIVKEWLNNYEISNVQLNVQGQSLKISLS